jgi:hypothetical protein
MVVSGMTVEQAENEFVKVQEKIIQGRKNGLSNDQLVQQLTANSSFKDLAAQYESLPPSEQPTAQTQGLLAGGGTEDKDDGQIYLESKDISKQNVGWAEMVALIKEKLREFGSNLNKETEKKMLERVKEDPVFGKQMMEKLGMGGSPSGSPSPTNSMPREGVTNDMLRHIPKWFGEEDPLYRTRVQGAKQWKDVRRPGGLSNYDVQSRGKLPPITSWPPGYPSKPAEVPGIPRDGIMGSESWDWNSPDSGSTRVPGKFDRLGETVPGLHGSWKWSDTRGHYWEPRKTKVLPNGYRVTDDSHLKNRQSIYDYPIGPNKEKDPPPPPPPEDKDLFGGYFKRLFNDPSRMALLQGGLSMMDPSSYYDKQGIYGGFTGFNKSLRAATDAAKSTHERLKLKSEAAKNTALAGGTDNHSKEYFDWQSERDRGDPVAMKGFTHWKFHMKQADKLVDTGTLFRQGMVKADLEALPTYATIGQKADTEIDTLNRARKTLESGIYTGELGPLKTWSMKILGELGLADPTKAEKTEVFFSDMAKQVMAILGSGVLGGGTGLSDADVEFAKAAAAGNVKMSEEAIREIMRISEIMALTRKHKAGLDLNAIGEKHNTDVSHTKASWDNKNSWVPGEPLPAHLQAPNWDTAFGGRFKGRGGQRAVPQGHSKL